MAKKKFKTCPKQRNRFLTPSLCSMCDKISKCDTFRQFYNKNKKQYNLFVRNYIEKFPEKYELGVIYMATKQIFIQLVDKKTGIVEKVMSQEELKGLDAEAQISLTKGKEIFIVTHRIEPVIKIELKQVKITESFDYQSSDEDVSNHNEEEETQEIIKEATVKKEDSVKESVDKKAKSTTKKKRSKKTT